MKYLVIILLFLNFSLYSQEVKIDSINYVSEDITVFENGTYKMQKDSNLFTFKSNKIVTSYNDQRRVFYKSDEWEHIKVKGNPMSVCQYTDNGGFKCNIAVGYDNEAQKNFIIIDYNNVNFFYVCNIAQIEKFEFLYPYEAPEYTNEEVDEFLQQYGNPDHLKNLMIIELLK
ncbi:MAG: hypothetical protein ACOC1K_06775 [Nanoarchaeota archaeon]